MSGEFAQQPLDDFAAIISFRISSDHLCNCYETSHDVLFFFDCIITLSQSLKWFDLTSRVAHGAYLDVEYLRDVLSVSGTLKYADSGTS